MGPERRSQGNRAERSINAGFYEDGSRVLTQEAFYFVFNNEMKRAVRLQNFITLIVLEASGEQQREPVAADDATVREVAELISRDVRETDLLGHTEQGTLSLVLFDANFEQSRHVVDRLTTRVESYEFPAPLQIAVGAACYPTHGAHVDELRHEAVSHPLVTWRREAASHNRSLNGN